MNRQLLQAVFKTAFVQWDYKYLAAIIQEHNTKSLRIADHLGFQQCGHIPGELWFGVLRRERCRWLEIEGRNSDVIH